MDLDRSYPTIDPSKSKPHAFNVMEHSIKRSSSAPHLNDLKDDAATNDDDNIVLKSAFKSSSFRTRRNNCSSSSSSDDEDSNNELYLAGPPRAEANRPRPTRLSLPFSAMAGGYQRSLFEDDPAAVISANNLRLRRNSSYVTGGSNGKKRLGGSGVVVPSNGSGKSSFDRLSQLKKEESYAKQLPQVDYKQEKHFQATAVASGRLHVFSLDEADQSFSEDSCSSVASEQQRQLLSDQRKRTTSLTEPMHIFTNCFQSISCSPSPSRSEKQCYSPSMQAVIKSNVFSPVASPTRKSYSQRSLSPIAVKTFKRKCDTDSDYFSSPKRFNYGGPGTTPDRIIAIPNYKHGKLPLEHSLSISSLESDWSANGCGELVTIGTSGGDSSNSTLSCGGSTAPPGMVVLRRRPNSSCGSLQGSSFGPQSATASPSSSHGSISPRRLHNHMVGIPPPVTPCHSPAPPDDLLPLVISGCVPRTSHAIFTPPSSAPVSPCPYTFVNNRIRLPPCITPIAVSLPADVMHMDTMEQAGRRFPDIGSSIGSVTESDEDANSSMDVAMSDDTI